MLRTRTSTSTSTSTIPVALDTDIGTDIDDVYALILAAVSPELDLRLVTCVNNDVEARARIAKKILRLLGRADVPVAMGERESRTPGVTRGWLGHEGRGIALDDVVPARDLLPLDAAAALARFAAESEIPPTLITIGPMTNVAAAFDQYPREMRRFRRIVAMASDFGGFGEENARGEHNVACDPVAFREVLDSGIPLTLIGLNVTRQTRMDTDDLAGLIVAGPRRAGLAEAVAGMHRVWFEVIGRDYSPMHDPLAVAVAFQPDLVTLVPARARMAAEPLETGAVVFDVVDPVDGVNRVDVTTGVDVAAFHRVFFERIGGAVGER